MPVSQSDPAPGVTSKTIRIALGDDHTLFRAGLHKLLAAEPDFEVVAEAGEGPDLLAVLEGPRPPDVLLLELRMPVVNGMEVLRHLQETGSATRALILTASESQQEMAQAMKLGACGVVLKSTPTEQLIQAVRRVAAGEIWLDTNVMAPMVKQFRASKSGRSKLTQAGDLTPREREIAALVGQGYRYREIAEMLSISEQTVKNHLRNMFHKLGVSDRLQLALYAIHHNL